MSTAAVRMTAMVVIAASSIIASGIGSASANPDGRHPGSSSSPTSSVSSQHDDLEYILMIDSHTTMSGTTRDLNRVQKLRRANEPILWLREAGKEYLIRDAATIQQAIAAWKPVNELGEQQGELGRQQGELGRRQGQIGMRQGQLGARQGELGTREAAVDLRLDTGSPSQTERDQLVAERREIRKQMRVLERDMRAAESPMRDLGGQMDILGHQMEALGNKMEAASRKATAEMHALVTRAIASGTAAPL